MKVGITGADGLIGWHVRAWLHTHRPDSEVLLATRATFADDTALADFATGLDVVIHCAGMNRGDDAEVEATNIDLAQRLIRACQAASATACYPGVIYTNSIHIERDTAYGRGKKTAGQLLAASAQQHGAAYIELILPNVFGEFGKPFYNSVVSTFCHQLAVGEVPQIHVDGEIELLHAQAVAAICMDAVETGKSGSIRVPGIKLKVSELLARLQAMVDTYIDRNIVPACMDGLALALFNTLRSYRFPQYAQRPLTLHQDQRGELFEAVKTYNGGQAFMSTTHPGVTRGNHFHTYKFERFLVCAGDAEIRLRRLFSDQVHLFRVSGDQPCYIDMPTFHTHSITNVGEREVMTMFWAGEIFDPAHPDTFSEKVLP